MALIKKDIRNKPITVGDLKKQLEDFPDDAPVYGVRDGCFDGYAFDVNVMDDDASDTPVCLINMS